MVIEQTVEIPAEPSPGCLHLDLPLPADHPSGRVKIEVRIIGEAEEVSGRNAEPGGLRVPTEEEAGRWREPLIKNDARLQEILKTASEKAEARKKDPSLGSLKKWHGVLENSKAWGKDVDVVAKIRAMRDEWDDPWDKSQDKSQDKSHERADKRG